MRKNYEKGGKTEKKTLKLGKNREKNRKIWGKWGKTGEEGEKKEKWV